MSRRFIGLISYSLAVLSLAACASTSNSAIAIGDNKISVSEFETIVKQLADAGQLELTNGTIDAETTHSLLGVFLRKIGTTRFLAEQNVKVSEEDIAAVEKQLSTDSNSSTLPSELKSLIVELNSSDLALRKIVAPTPEAAAKLYDDEPARLGALCLQHVLVRDEATARKVLALANDGGDFSKLAGEYSTEPGADKSGGILSGATSECLLLSEIQAQFDAAFTAGALQAKAGRAYGPVKSSFGWHIILVRPFTDISESLSATIATDPGNILLTGYLATASVKVKSSYGRWDPSTGKIIAN